MIFAALINYALGFITTVTLMSNLGDLQAALNDRSKQPYVAVIYEITGSKAATIVLVGVMIIMVSWDGLPYEEDERVADVYGLTVLFLQRQPGDDFFTTSLRVRQRQGMLSTYDCNCS